jgi:hypothetical protein
MGALNERHKVRQAKEQRGRCFYCSLPLRDDMTWEHLVARADGGSNKACNLKVAHGVCNSMMGTLDVKVKYAMAEIGHTLGSDAFFLLAERLKPQANTHKGERRIRQRRPKRPPAPVHQAHVLQLVRLLPPEVVDTTPHRIAA